MAADGGVDKGSRPPRDVYRKVSRRMWSDAKFMALSGPQPNGQSLLVHLLTGPHTGMIPGLSVAGQAQLAEQLGWDLGSQGLPEGLRQGLPEGLPEGCVKGMPDGFRQAFEELAQQGIAVADWRARLVWLPKAVYHNEPESPNVVRSWRSSWTEIPECDLKHVAWKGLRAFMEARGATFLEAFEEALPEPFREPLPAPLPPPLGESRTRTGTGVRAVTGAGETTGTLFESSAPPPSASAAEPGDPVEIWVPFEGKEPPTKAKHGPWRAGTNGAHWEYGVTASLLVKLRDLYPGVEVENAAHQFADWCYRNPAKRKTYSGAKCGVLESLHFWLGKRQNEGNGAKANGNGKTGAYHPAGRPNIVAGIDRSLLGAPDDLEQHERELREMDLRTRRGARIEAGLEAQ